MALLAVLAVTSILTTVSAGHVGIVDVFGNVRPMTLKSGLQFVNPMAKVVEMSVQTQEIKETMDVPSKEGMTMTIEVSVLYHLDPEKASDIYRSVGKDYAAVLLEPQFRSVTRGVTAGLRGQGALHVRARAPLAAHHDRSQATRRAARHLHRDDAAAQARRCQTSCATRSRRS